MENFTPIPNSILDNWMSNMKYYSFKVLMAICRKILGYEDHRDALEDYISLSQLQKLTGLPRITVIRSIKELEDKKLIVVDRTKKINKIKLKINSNHELPIQNEIVTTGNYNSNHELPIVVTTGNTQKKKETITKEISPHHKLIKYFTDKYKELTNNDLLWLPRYNKDIQRLLKLTSEDELYKRLNIYENKVKGSKNGYHVFTPDRFYIEINSVGNNEKFKDDLDKYCAGYHKKNAN